MECGSCTLCCTLLNIPWMNSQAGDTCKYCDKGCIIQDTKDDRCREFDCAYTQMSNVSEQMRPDNFGVIFEKLNDDLMFGTVNPKHKDFKYMNGQINAFLEEGINTVLSKSGIPVVFHTNNVTPESLLKRVHKIASR